MSLDIKLHLFGDRVLFEPVDEELVGSILLPQTRNKQYELGRVLQVGNGRVRDANNVIKDTKLIVKPGDIIWFQVIPQMMANCALRLRGKTYLNVVQHDLIGRLKSTTVTLENFEILGYWVLLDSFEDPLKEESKIYIPDTVKENPVRALRYYVKQKGEFVTDINVGDEVVLDKRAAQMVTLNGDPYFYTDSRYIQGVAESTPELEKAVKDKLVAEHNRTVDQAKQAVRDLKLKSKSALILPK